jgi:hypothetical protein
MLSLGEPSHGWIDITFGDDGDSYTESVSDVPNDCLRDLVLATSRLLATSTRENVEFALEPGSLRCELVRKGAALILPIFQSEAPTSAFSAEFPLRAFADRLHSEMVRIKPRIDTDDGWTQPFPEREVSHLGRRG